MSIPLGHYWWLLAKYLRPQRRRVAVLFVLLMTSITLQVANPQLIARFIDEALTGPDTSQLTWLAIAFILTAVAAQTLAVLATYISENVAWTATNELRADLAAHCLGLDMSFHKTRTPGEMITRIDGDVDALSNFFSQFVLSLLGNLLLLAGVLFVLFLEDWRIGLATAAFATLTLVVMTRLRSIAVPHWVALRERQAMFYGFLSETLEGREDLRGNGGRGYTMSLLRAHMREWYGLTIRSVQYSHTWLNIASVGLFSIWTAMALGFTFLLWEAGSLSVGSAYLVFHYLELVRRPIDQIREQVQQLQAASASIVRVEGLFSRTSALRDDGAEALPDGALSLDLDGVTFAYEGDDAVLRDVSLALRPGEVLGLLGRTGSGKTTIGRLLVRLYDVETGAIRLGGVPVAGTSLAELRRRVAVVSQDVQLFDGSVRDNLTFFNEAIPDEALYEALTSLGLLDWVVSLPHGLDTVISADSLSAGQAQLLACGRAFLRDPGLIVLDEATSRLDPYTQGLADEAMARLLRGRTAVVIAHRLATIDRADRIAILEDGELVEEGARLDLLRDETSRFARLRDMEMEAELT